MKRLTKRHLSKLLSLALSLLLLLVLTPTFSAASSTFIRKGNTNEKVVALTFDDGSDGTNFNRIVSILDKHNIKATFFLTGSGAETHPGPVQDVFDAGHDIGNHSYNHPDFTDISTTSMQDQLARTETIISNITGVSTKPFFRAPYGATNQTVLNTVGNAGYLYTLHWTIDTIDWTGNSATAITSRVMDNIVPGAIILMHTGAGAAGTPQALETIIPRLKNMGYRFVTISELLNISANPPANNNTTQTYTVKAGDTLYAIALRYGTTISQLVSLNHITNPNLIRIGQVLRLPGNHTPAPVPTPTPTLPSTSTTSYTVKPNDTLYAIALKYGVSINHLVQMNNISNPNLILIEQVLLISQTTQTPAPTPPPATTTTYTVKSGDTLYALALRYQTSVSKIVQLNNISNPNLILVGQVLRIK